MDCQEIRKKYACDETPIQTTSKNRVLAEVDRCVRVATVILGICKKCKKSILTKEVIPENIAKASSSNLELLNTILPKLRQF